MKRLSVGVLGLVVASTGIVGCAGLVAGSALATLKLKTISLPGGVLQQAYSASVSVTGGRPPYVWGIISGQLPPGLALSTVSGGISGTPLQTGSFTFSVQVKDSTGHSDSSAYSLNIASVPAPNPAPTISGASPNSGPTSGGTAVTISGTNFQTGATVLFGGLGAASVTVISATQIQVLTPTHIAGPVDVTVRNPDGQSATLSSGFTYTAPPPVNPPTITGISPNSGPTSGGTTVTITGANFQSGATVLFGGSATSSVSVVSATQIQVTTPAHVGGSVDVTVQNLDGQSATLRGGFTYTAPLPAPSIARISPNSGPTPGGTAVTITGANFQAGASLVFGGLAASPVIFVNATQIQVMTPVHVAGPVDVTVQNPDGQSATLRSGFVYTAASPMVSSVSPNTGLTAGGTSVSITGTNFMAGALVLFGTTSAPTVTVNSATQIQAVTPAKAAGLVDVTVQNPDGQSGMMTGAFTYTAPPPGSGAISVTPAAYDSSIGSQIQYHATQNGNDITAACIWGSSDTAIATISTGGLATAVGNGITTITCTH